MNVNSPTLVLNVELMQQMHQQPFVYYDLYHLVHYVSTNLCVFSQMWNRYRFALLCICDRVARVKYILLLPDLNPVCRREPMRRCAWRHNNKLTLIYHFGTEYSRQVVHKNGTSLNNLTPAKIQLCYFCFIAILHWDVLGRGYNYFTASGTRLDGRLLQTSE